MTDKETNNVETEETNATDKKEEFTARPNTFAVSQLNDAGEYVEQAVAQAERAGAKIFKNYDGDELPENHGVAVIPYYTKSENGPALAGLTIAAVPSLELFASAGDKGEAFIADAVHTIMQQTISAAMRPLAKGEAPRAFPRSVADWLAPRTRAGSTKLDLKGFRAVAKAYVKYFTDQGASFMTMQLLRTCLESQTAATKLFPTLNADSWNKILDSMEKAVTKLKHDTAFIDQWRETREQASEEAEEEFELSLDDLDDIN